MLELPGRQRYSALVDESLDDLDTRIGELRARIRHALRAGAREEVRLLRADLRDAESAWHALTEREEQDGEPDYGDGAGSRETRRRIHDGDAAGSPGTGGVFLPLREQVHQALTLLTVPAAPRLISAVHEAFFAGAIPGARLTSLRRDEERSFRTAPFARPYYLCAALTADYLSPVRGLFAVSTWPMEKRVIGSLSPRVDYLVAAIQISGSLQRISEPSRAATRLLWRFAANIPGAAGGGQPDAEVISDAARAELAVHADADAAARKTAATRARRQLDDTQQLFGVRMGTAPRFRADG